MSCNWYLYRDGLPCKACGHDKRESRVHIGLSAVGWVFLWRGWRDAEESPFGTTVLTPADWYEILREAVAQGAVIKDEYDRVKPLEEFLAFVEGKRDARNVQRHGDFDKSRDCAHVGGDDIAFYEFS